MSIQDEIKKAVLLTHKGLYNDAESLYLNLIEIEPDNHLLLSFLGLLYLHIKQLDKAEIYLKKACEIKATLGTLSALGFYYFEKRDYEESAIILEKSLAYGDDSNVYNKLIFSLFSIKSFKKAVKYSEIMYEKFPNDINANTNMVKALTQSGNLLEAEKMCVEYLKKNLDSASMWIHLGFLKELIYSDDLQALECFKKALDLGYFEAYYNIGISYQKQGDLKNAEKFLIKMLQYFPDDVDTITALGMCKLAQKNFKEGYDYFFKRNKVSLDKKTSNPWKKGDIWNEEVVVLCDQGFGDHIQFVRYLPFLKEKTKKIFVAVPEALKSLFKKNYPFAEFISFDEIDSSMQSIRITDLAYALNIDFENIPFSQGYLSSDVLDIKNKKLKVGLCWEAGGAGIRTMLNRTINIKFFEPILDLKNVEIYSFQVKDTMNGHEKYPQIINLAKDFKDFNDTAKALKAMDILISVDTSVAHLAGALGVKTFLMLPYATDWRWFSDIKTTPWYDSFEIFKQVDNINWEKPIEDIICRIKEYCL